MWEALNHAFQLCISYEVAVVPIDSAPDAMNALAARYSQYAERTPPGPLLRLTVDRALHWRAAG